MPPPHNHYHYPPGSNESPYLGMIVHYKLGSGPNAGQCRAAIVVSVPAGPTGYELDLHLFALDADGPPYKNAPDMTNVPHSDAMDSGDTWHNRH